MSAVIQFSLTDKPIDVTSLAGELVEARKSIKEFSGNKAGRASVVKSGQSVTKNTAELLASVDNETSLKDLAGAKMLRCRVRYFTDGAVIGSREFVHVY